MSREDVVKMNLEGYLRTNDLEKFQHAILELHTYCDSMRKLIDFYITLTEALAKTTNDCLDDLKEAATNELAVVREKILNHNEIMREIFKHNTFNFGFEYALLHGRPQHDQLHLDPNFGTRRGSLCVSLL